LGSEIGQISFVVPDVVRNELFELQKNPSKYQDATDTLDYIKNFKTIKIIGTFADKELVNYISKNKSIIATMDKDLKNQIKNYGRSILSVSKNRIILEA